MNLISLSGGKDSTAMLLLAMEKGVDNMRVVFCDTGNEHPITYEYIQYLADKLQIKIETIKADFSKNVLIRKKNLPKLWAEKGISEERIKKAVEVLNPTGIPFLDLALSNGFFPSSKCRSCTAELKVNLIRKRIYIPTIAKGEDIESWQGIRWDESKARAKAKEHEFIMCDKTTGAEVWNYRPILSWKAADCFAMLKKHGVDPNPLYKLGMSRVGCMPCIFTSKSDLAQIAVRFPEVIDKVEKWENLIGACAHRGKSNFLSHGGGNIREMVDWSKTVTGGRQYKLFGLGNDLPACSSEYGLCE